MATKGYRTKRTTEILVDHLYSSRNHVSGEKTCTNNMKCTWATQTQLSRTKRELYIQLARLGPHVGCARVRVACTGIRVGCARVFKFWYPQHKMLPLGV